MRFNGNLYGKKVLITAGPTQEAIDPVRYISNHSTGKMGYSIAAAFLQRGCAVTLVSGPVSLSLEGEQLRVLSVVSASQMMEVCQLYFQEVDIAVFCAAVADYRPSTVAAQKIKKDDDEMVISLVKNGDIAREFGKVKKESQYSVGFALETRDEKTHAFGKMERKGLDMVVLNSMNDAGAGFAQDTNKITILTKSGREMQFPLKLKRDVAEDILETIESEYFNNRSAGNYGG